MNDDAPNAPSMKLIFAPQAWEDYWLYWSRSTNRRVPRSCINRLIKEIVHDPFAGIGRPTPLKHVLEGWWSRRIDGEHRMVYKIVGDQLWIAQLRFHY